MKDNNFISLFNNLFIYRFQFYHKLRQRYRQTKDTNTSHEPSSFSSVRIILIEIQIFIFLFQILPISYNSLTPLTTTTTTNKSNPSLQQHFNTDNHSINIYDEIRLSSDHHSFAYYQQKTPYYYTYELSPSKIVCPNCLLKTLHQKQQCLCRNFFVPIK
jgi:hypothetical protein